MFLKNYTSDVSVSDSLARIEHVLVRCGVSGIAKEYSQRVPGKIIGISFFIEVGSNKLSVQMPVDEEKCLEAMWADYRRQCSNPNLLKKTKQDFIRQAERTAWRILKDWIEVQMSMIQLNQADTVQVFLPYLYNGKETVYQQVKARGYRALLPPPSETDK